jgi:uncharacterized sulfatase
VTGLYTQQTWCAATYAPILGNTPPELSPDMPTYGKLFQAAGYDTPYMGKWHLSEPWKTGMARYGFDGITEQYSLDAGNLQGTYSDPNYVNSDGEVNPFYNDEFIAKTAASWLQNKQVGDRPWCLTVGLQNPHDYQFFPSGTEFKTFTNLFTSGATNPSGSIQAATYSSQPSATGVNWETNIFNNFNASAYGYPAVPPNWEALDSLWKNKPKYQMLCRQWNGMQFGSASELPSNLNKPAYDSNTVTQFLILSKVNDETNLILTFNKKPGTTSLGFIIPNNLHPDVLANIDVITKEVKQKLIDLGTNSGGGTF